MITSLLNIGNLANSILSCEEKILKLTCASKFQNHSWVFTMEAILLWLYRTARTHSTQDVTGMEIWEINNVKIFVSLLPDLLPQVWEILEKLYYNVYTGLITCFVQVFMSCGHLPVIINLSSTSSVMEAYHWIYAHIFIFKLALN